MPDAPWLDPDWRADPPEKYKYLCVMCGDFRFTTRPSTALVILTPRYTQALNIGNVSVAGNRVTYTTLTL